MGYEIPGSGPCSYEQWLRWYYAEMPGFAEHVLAFRKRIMEKTWDIVAETRQRGAIGLFQHERFTVDAVDKESARTYAFNALQARGLETRGIAVTERK